MLMQFFVALHSQQTNMQYSAILVIIIFQVASLNPSPRPVFQLPNQRPALRVRPHGNCIQPDAFI
jgi:hypothetical protein